MSTSSPTSTQPGWYADPESPGQLRWFDGEAWSPFTKEGSAEVAPAAPTAVPQQRTTSAPTAPTETPGASWAPAAATAPRPAARQAQPAAPRPAAASATHAPGPAVPPAQPPAHPSTAHPSTATARPTAPATPLSPVPVAPAPVAAWPSDVGRPTGVPAAPAVQGFAAARAATASTSTSTSVQGLTVSRPVVSVADRPPTPLRRLVGRLAGNLPAWLPEPVAERLFTRMTTYAARDDRFSDRLTAANLKELVFPLGSAWQGSVAACLGLVTLVLSVWPLAGLGAWVATSAFAGWALLRIRRDVMLGGKVHAWVGIACGIGPLWTGLLMVAYH